MNKYESALKIIELYVKPWEIKIDNCGREISNETKKINLNLLKELVDKETSKKPDYEGDGYSDGELVYDTWICPNCGNSYEVDYEEYERCPHCGQMIDWSE